MARIVATTNRNHVIVFTEPPSFFMKPPSFFVFHEIATLLD